MLNAGLAPDLWRTRVDPSETENAILNLAINARDAMPGGGTLTIGLNPLEVTDAYVNTHPEARPGNFVCLRVSDTGVGMDTTIINRIFEPFFTTKEAGKGTGLGLYVSHQVIKEHRGTIHFETKPGAGTKFIIILPDLERSGY